MDAAQQRRLIALLDELAGAVEDLLLSGLTAASEATRERLAVGFREASRHRLLRLGSTLRIATQEMKRFDDDDDGFSASRLAFFLGRAWMLATSMAGALREADLEAFAGMNRTPPMVPLDRVDLVVIGVFKRHVVGAFCAFELRGVLTREAGPLEAGEGVVIPFVFPDKPGLPPEAFLALEQKQKFRPSALLEGRGVTLRQTLLADGSPRRLVLGPQTRVAVGELFTDWASVLRWDRDGALARIDAHEPDPLTLPVELQEVVCLRDWALGTWGDPGEGYHTAVLEADGLDWQLRTDAGPSGEPAREALAAAAVIEPRPVLVALLHYELCALVLHPIATVAAGEAPRHINVAEAHVDKAALIRSLNLT